MTSLVSEEFPNIGDLKEWILNMTGIDEEKSRSAKCKYIDNCQIFYGKTEHN